MKNIKIMRMFTGEDVIADVNEGAEGVTCKKAFAIIPMQAQPGKPVQLMMTPFMPYSADEEIVIHKDKIVAMVKPKPDILKSYEQNTSTILSPQKELITESKLPKL
jgi:hypothetical protein|tara:strand:- start:120 stop:437 length:318 start_codon:yes stop_codon:yes gene_type:complete